MVVLVQVALLIVAAALASAKPSFGLHHTHPHLFAPPHHRARFGAVMATRRARPLAPAPPLIVPTEFGADPTGVQDSTHALQTAIITALSRHAANHSLADGIVDCGGATVDLEGGDYLVSAPLVVPPGYGNLRIQRGTLRASTRFQGGDFLLRIGSEVCTTNKQQSCNENIGLSELFIDGAQRTGGVFIGTTMGANVGPQMFFLGFVGAGLRVKGGHEVMVHEAWLGEYLYSDPRKANTTLVTATGVDILGNDHVVSNVIVFSARIGLSVVGGANFFVGVHTWNLATAYNGTGIYLNAPSATANRFVGCYLDYNDFVLASASHLIFVDGFFLGGAKLVMRANGPHDTVRGVTVTGCQFTNGNHPAGEPGFVVDESEGTFIAVEETVISQNQFKGVHPQSTRVTAQLTQTNAVRWHFDLADQLVFKRIQIVQYSLQRNDFAGVFVMHASEPPEGAHVSVVTSGEAHATVTVTVDESVVGQGNMKLSL